MDQIILVWDRCGFILDQHGLGWIRQFWDGVSMDLFWTNMDYVGSDNSGFGVSMDLFWTNKDYAGSDNSGLGSVWIYSGPTKSQARISGPPW